MYRIPGEDDVARAISYVLSRYGTVRSQERLARMVTRVLGSTGTDYRVSGTRVRLIALKHRVAKVTVETREAENTELDIHCPVCGTMMSEVRNRTLDGKTTVIGYACPSCSYRTGNLPRRPQRYIFSPIMSRKRGGEERA